MAERGSRFVNRGRPLLLSLALLVLAGGPGRPTTAAGQAGEFPAYIPISGVTPAGITVDKIGNVYLGVRETISGVLYGKIWKFTPAGEQSFFAQIGAAELYGLTATADGDIYAAMARVGSGRGVFRVDRKGNIELVAGSDQIVFPNAIAFDERGTMYVTESYSGIPPDYGQGGIWRIPKGGEAELWLRSGLLTGIKVAAYPVGANGIAFYHGHLYVTNTFPGRIVRIPVLPDGSAGDLEVWTTLQEVPESPLAGSPFPLMADDLRLDVHGNVYVAVLSRAAVVRINASDKSQETIAAFQLVPHGSVPNIPLDFPASFVFGTGKGERQNLFVSSLGWGKMYVPAIPWPGAGLAKVDAGAPGDPQH